MGDTRWELLFVFCAFVWHTPWEVFVLFVLVMVRVIVLVLCVSVSVKVIIVGVCGLNYVLVLVSFL